MSEEIINGTSIIKPRMGVLLDRLSGNVLRRFCDLIVTRLIWGIRPGSIDVSLDRQGAGADCCDATLATSPANEGGEPCVQAPVPPLVCCWSLRFWQDPHRPTSRSPLSTPFRGVPRPPAS